MKIKELQKTVNITWSPSQLNQLYLAAGTAAQELDTDNSSATLELYEIDLTDPGYDLVLRAECFSIEFVEVFGFKFSAFRWFCFKYALLSAKHIHFKHNPY